MTVSSSKVFADLVVTTICILFIVFFLVTILTSTLKSVKTDTAQIDAVATLVRTTDSSGNHTSYILQSFSPAENVQCFYLIGASMQCLQTANVVTVQQ